MKGLFIAFEGIDGCGKTTQIEKVAAWLESRGVKTEIAHEPNDLYPIGQTIKKMLRGEMDKTEDPKEFQRLYVIDRAQDIVSFIKPALTRGEVFIMDRFVLSTIAFGMLSNLTAEELISMHEEVMGSHLIWPDLNIILDVPGKKSASRIIQTRASTEFFDKEAWLEKVRQNYLNIATSPKFKKTTVVIDGARDIEEVFEDVKHAIELILPARK